MSKTKPTTNTNTGGDPNSTTSSNKSGIGSGSGSGSTETGKQVEKDNTINLVEQDKPKTINIELETETKEEKKVTPKPKKPKKKKEPTKKSIEKAQAEQIKDIQNLLEGVFMVISLKGGDHWTLQSDESKQIAEPLSKILDRYDLLNKTSEISDPVALIIATMTIILPRLMISKMTVTEKKKKTLEKNGVMNSEQKGSPTSNGGSDDRTVKRTTQSNDGQFIKSISTEIQTGF